MWIAFGLAVVLATILLFFVALLLVRSPRSGLSRRPLFSEAIAVACTALLVGGSALLVKGLVALPLPYAILGALAAVAAIILLGIALWRVLGMKARLASLDAVAASVGLANSAANDPGPRPVDPASPRGGRQRNRAA